MLHVIFTPEGIPAHISTDPRPGSEPVEPKPEWGDCIAFLAGHRRTAKGEWVPRDPVRVPDPAPEELAARAAEEARQAHEAAEQARKWQGVLFDGVWCSATRDDQNGLMAVERDFMAEGANFEPTRFEFSNGNTLVLHRGNVMAFAAVWKPFRKSFFKVAE